MQAKIINKTTLTKREIIVSQLLNNRFLMIIYAVTLLLFIIIRIFSVINGINISTTQTVLSVLIIIVCLGVILYPFFNAIRWERRYKKLYGVTTQNIEYHFFDIYVKVINHSINEETKIEYRRFRKRTETKKYISIILDDNATLFIDKNGFMKDNDYSKLDAYLKRFSL